MLPTTQISVVYNNKVISTASTRLSWAGWGHCPTCPHSRAQAGETAVVRNITSHTTKGKRSWKGLVLIIQYLSPAIVLPLPLRTSKRENMTRANFRSGYVKRPKKKRHAVSPAPAQDLWMSQEVGFKRKTPCSKCAKVWESRISRGLDPAGR